MTTEQRIKELLSHQMKQQKNMLKDGSVNTVI